MNTVIAQNEINRSSKESGEYNRPESTYQRTFVPRIDIWEGEGELVLQADMPGVQPDKVDIRFENRELTIRGEVSPSAVSERLLVNEFSMGDFHRTFSIGEAIDTEKISAEMNNGVLTLHLPKSEKVKPRRITVNA